MKEEQIFKEHLRKSGLKFTPERRAVLEEVFSIHEHFDVERLFAGFRRKKKNISRATIYRTLPLLMESGLVKGAVLSGDRVLYEHVFGHNHHDHLICLKCGKAIEFVNESIENLQKKVCKKYGFKPVEHKLEIQGYCKKCQNS